MHDLGLYLTHRLKREGKETDKYFFKVAEEFLSCLQTNSMWII